jgi:hypothetical protein
MLLHLLANISYAVSFPDIKKVLANGKHTNFVQFGALRP